MDLRNARFLSANNAERHCSTEKISWHSRLTQMLRYNKLIPDQRCAVNEKNDFFLLNQWVKLF